MKIFVAKHPLGTFIFDESKKFMKFIPVALEEALKEFGEYEIKSNDPEILEMVRKNIREYTKDYFKSDQEFNALLSFSAAQLAKNKVKASQKKDRILVQTVLTYNSMTKVLNQLNEHLAEWFGIHYPECELSHKELMEYVSEYGNRENFPGFEQSTGLELDEEDEAMIRKYASALKTLSGNKEEMEIYIKNLAKYVIPNFSGIIDPMLAAKILSLAGSLKNLARLPSSTIQILGAEKALFRHVRKKQNKPPKYGIIYLSSYLQNAPDELKGKVARIIASKLMVAARLDFYSDIDKSEQLTKELELAIEKVRKKHDRSI